MARAPATRPRKPGTDPVGNGDRAPLAPLKPAELKIGEGADNLRARGEAWRKRHGGGDAPRKP